MKKTLFWFALPALMIITLQVRGQDPDKEPLPVTQKAGSGIKAIKPGDFKTDPSRFPTVDVTYKVAVTKGTEKKDGGLLIEKCSVDKKKNQVTIIKIHKQDKDQAVDTAILNLETLALIYHSKTDKTNRVYKSYKHQPKEPSEVYFDGDVLNYFFSMLPDEKYEPTAVVLFSTNEGSAVKSSIVNVKDELMYANVTSDDGIYIVDFGCSNDSYRFIINRKTHRTEIIELRKQDGTLYEFSMVK